MLTPDTEAGLAETLRTAREPLAIVGGGTRGLDQPGTPLSTRNLTGITLYDPGALTLVARAGTSLAEIEGALAAENQMLAFEPMDHRPLLGTKGEPTIGGVVAANVSGPRRVQSGACRDFLLGVRFVDGEGTVIKNGGRVMKNVTGYDLARLMCGARGTLGVVTEISLKVLPKPETEATLVIGGVGPERSADVMSRALATPYEVSGAFFGPYDEEGQVCLRVEGRSNSVSYRLDRLKSMFADFGDLSGLDEESSKQRWSEVRNVTCLADAHYVSRTAFKPCTAPKFIETIGQSYAFTAYADWGGGLVWIGATEDQLLENARHASDEAQRTDPNEGAALLHTACQNHMRGGKGHTTLVKATEGTKQAIKVFQPEVEPLARLAHGLRRKFDPKGILNPGLMG